MASCKLAFKRRLHHFQYISWELCIIFFSFFLVQMLRCGWLEDNSVQCVTLRYCNLHSLMFRLIQRNILKQMTEETLFIPQLSTPHIFKYWEMIARELMEEIIDHVIMHGTWPHLCNQSPQIWDGTKHVKKMLLT